MYIKLPQFLFISQLFFLYITIDLYYILFGPPLSTFPILNHEEHSFGSLCRCVTECIGSMLFQGGSSQLWPFPLANLLSLNCVCTSERFCSSDSYGHEFSNVGN